MSYTPKSDNYCAIEVWVPKNTEGKHIGTTASTFSDSIAVGHVALWTKEIYASFWPGDDELNFKFSDSLNRFKKNYARLKKKKCKDCSAVYLKTYVNGALSHDYPADKILKEGKHSDFTIILYSLDVKKINKTFREFEKKLSEKKVYWSLLGRNPYNFFTSKQNNPRFLSIKMC